MRTYYSLCFSITNNRKENSKKISHTVDFLCLTALSSNLLDIIVKQQPVNVSYTENGRSAVFKIKVPHAVKLKASDTSAKQKTYRLTPIIGLDT